MFLVPLKMTLNRKNMQKDDLKQPSTRKRKKPKPMQISAPSDDLQRRKIPL